MDTTTVLLTAGAILLLAAAAFAFLRLRGDREEPYYHFRCPGCGRRLRYRARQTGHAGQCNHCGHGVTFPPVAQSVE
jgi:hypothetical protein